MQLTKFTHACVRLDDGERRLVIDPGVFSEVEEALDGVDAVLVTHEHPDHIDTAKLAAALSANPRLKLFAPASVVDSFGAQGEQVVTVEVGQRFEAGGFRVRTFGGQHALIHPTIPCIANIGFLVDDVVYHPGDSFAVPNVQVETLLLPTNAPWSKASEVIDFAVSVRAPRVHQIHDSLITSVYAGMIEGHLGRIAGPFGVDYQPLATKQTVDV